MMKSTKMLANDIFRLNFEFPPSGGIVSSGEFTTVKLLRYITKSDYALMGKREIF